VIERMLQVDVFARRHDRQSYMLRARWHADGDLTAHAELSLPPGQGESPAPAVPGGVVGRITVTWRSMPEGLGVLGKLIRPVSQPLRQVWTTDPGEIEIEIDQSVTGRPLHSSTQLIGVTPNYWKVTGDDTQWWTSIVVYPDGVPNPAELGET
jgi:hypothetical protein